MRCPFLGRRIFSCFPHWNAFSAIKLPDRYNLQHSDGSQEVFIYPKDVDENGKNERKKWFVCLSENFRWLYNFSFLIFLILYYNRYKANRYIFFKSRAIRYTIPDISGLNPLFAPLLRMTTIYEFIKRLFFSSLI